MKNNSWPWVVHLENILTDNKNFTRKSVCVGTLVHQNWICKLKKFFIFKISDFIIISKNFFK